MVSKSDLDVVSEDTVRCIFFPTMTSNNAYNLEELCVSLNKTIQNLTAEYIWHRDELKVHLPLNAKTDFPPHLMSLTCFGDNIEDEWYIVFLLLEISKEYPDLVVQVCDNDGEFLLIEAADFLPSWANPDTTHNRVFIHQNYVHFIPRSIVDIETDLKVDEAIKILCDMSDQTKSSEIQQAVLKRIGDPHKLIQNIHRAALPIPLNIAALLALKPSLISPIVHAYCLHDVIDAKACKDIQLSDCVVTQVKFTKCLYAMLIHSKLMKTVRLSKTCQNDKKYELGLKLACGYEIIMRKLSSDLFSSKKFNIFLKSLTQNGYFKGNIEGSRDYMQLLDNAKKYFLTMKCPINTQVSNIISEIIQTNEFAKSKETIKGLSSQKSLEEDSDDWLNIHPDQLNNLLNTRYGKQTKYKTGDVIDSSTITSELSHFLKQTSDFEGIETNTEDTEGNVEFVSEMFVNSLKKMMDFIAPVNDMDSDYDDDIEDVSLPEDLDKELKEKLHVDENTGAQNIIFNMMQSMREEGGASGPSSNILKSIGLNKTDILDSDDDEE